jgi:hypothetical protein
MSNQVSGKTVSFTSLLEAGAEDIQMLARNEAAIQLVQHQ